MLKASGMIHIETRRSSSISVVIELTHRYFWNLWFNPGILGTRLAMYAMLALMIGALFWDLGHRDDIVAFFIFMSVAVLPFTVMERDIVDKEVLNKYYHPVMYQMAQGLTTNPSAEILASITALTITTMLKLNDLFWYFRNMFLSLLISEALASRRHWRS